MTHDSTICAISTPAGTGGMAVIRISGKEAFSVTDKIFQPVKKSISVVKQLAYTLSYGKIYANQGVADQVRHDRDEMIDEVIVAVFRAPHSFTGEDVVEISCHGSVYIQQEILRILVENGCTLARPGEFTQRAFLNGKMDLSQAEALADVIASSSEAAHRLAMNQMRGGFSHDLLLLRTQLLDFVSLIELELDFGEEDVEFADRNRLSALASRIEAVITRLVESFKVGNVIKNGIPVVIVGETNAGKSTLLNHLLNEEKAIVSDIHGTTRDAIEDIINIQGILFRFIDTAGIRNTSDVIENLGIERTFQKIDQATIILWMIDTTHYSKEIEFIAEQIIPRTQNKKLILIINKIDKLTPEEQAVLDEEFLPYVPSERIYLSAKYKTNTDILEQALLKAANLPEINDQEVIVTNLRHYEALSQALEALRRARKGLQAGLFGDLVSQDIRECMHYLGEITGEVSTDEVLGNIFRRFCIGK